jgi:hypothetical protein
MGAVALMLNTKLSSVNVSWHHPISCSNNCKLPYKDSTSDLTIETQRTDRILSKMNPRNITV